MSPANTGKSKGLVIVISIVGACIVAALVVVIILLLNKKEPVIAPEVEGGRGTLVVSENAQEIKEKLEQPIPDSYYQTSMNVDWSFNKSTEPSKNAYVENATNNTRTIYFDVIVNDTQETVFSSPFIPVGGVLEKFALTSDLKKGTYPATVVYHLVDDDKKDITTVSVSVTLHIGA